MSQSKEYELDIDDKEHCKSVMSKLNLMRRDKQDCDFVIVVGKETIHVHKHIVRASSDYFDAMFSHETIEKQEGIVRMNDVEGFAVQKCVDFMYTGKLSVSVEQCDKVLFSANMMQLNELRETISLFLEGHMDLVTFFTIRKIALKYSLALLLERCDEFAEFKFLALSKLDEFNEISVSYLIKLLSSDVTTTIIEDSKLATIIQWVKSNQDDRIADLTSLLKLIDFTKLTTGYCAYLVEMDPLCSISVGLMRLLFSAVVPSNKDSRKGPPDIEVEKQLDNCLIIFDEEKENVLSYFPSESSVMTVVDFQPSMKTDFFCACSAKNMLLIFTCYGRFLMLNYSALEWIENSHMLHLHGDSLRCAIHNDYIYVGGLGSLERIKMVNGSQWEDVDLHEHICDLTALVAHSKNLYLIGGKSDDGDAINTVVRKFPNTKWTSVSSMHVKRKDANAVVYDGNIYVAGGMEDDSPFDQFEIYNDETDVWTILKCGIYPSSDFSLHVVNNDMFAVSEDCVKVYNFSDCNWNDVEGIKFEDICWPGTTTASLLPPKLT